MEKLWAGRAQGGINALAEQLNKSITFDKRLYKQDITGSVAHAKMLAKQKIISEKDADEIIKGLNEILNDIESGKLVITDEAEDIHSFVEGVLTERIGDAGKKLHTARSRNDQVALDLRLYLKDEITEIITLIKSLVSVLCDKAEQYKSAVMSGYTHMQRAQPVTFGFHLCAYCAMFLRDIDRLKDVYKRVNVSPIGSCALAGTTFDTDRFYEAELLDFDGVAFNAMDGVSDRDFCAEFISACAIIATHLSRFSEELVLWSSKEFGFIEMTDEFTTGSSIMPQKKNPDMAELVRGKTGRVFGDLTAIFTLLKGLPLAYNKDLQEDKERVFDCTDTIKLCLAVFAPMIDEMKVNTSAMFLAAQKGFINATDLADYLAKKGVPFRSAYKTVGALVKHCIDTDCVLENLPLTEYKKFSDKFEEDLYEAIDLYTCVNKRISYGATGVCRVEEQIKLIKNTLENA